MGLVLEVLLPLSLDGVGAAPPPSDALFVESALEPPEVGEEPESPVLDWAPVEDDDSDFIAFFRDSEG